MICDLFSGIIKTKSYRGGGQEIEKRHVIMESRDHPTATDSPTMLRVAAIKRWANVLGAEGDEKMVK